MRYWKSKRLFKNVHSSAPYNDADKTGTCLLYTSEKWYYDFTEEIHVELQQMLNVLTPAKLEVLMIASKIEKPLDYCIPVSYTHLTLATENSDK